MRIEPENEKQTSVYLAVDLSGRKVGHVLGFYQSLEDAELWASNTGAHIHLFEIKATPR